MQRRASRLFVAACLLTASLLVGLPEAASAHSGPVSAAANGACDVHAPQLAAIMTMGPNLSLNNNRVVDVQAWSYADRARVHMWDYLTTGNYYNQRWCFSDGLGWTEIINENSGKCLDKSMDLGDVNGAVVYQYTCYGTSNQYWWRDRGRGAGGGDRFINLEDNRCLDIKNKVDANDASLQVWDCNSSGWNQSWGIVSPY
jgi:hypothetical protein